MESKAVAECESQAVLPADLRERLPRFFEEAQWFLEQHPYMAAILTVPLEVGAGGSQILSLVNPDKLRRMLGYMLNENEFLCSYGIRSLSRYHADHPYVFNAGGHEYRIGYVLHLENEALENAWFVLSTAA